MGRFREIFGGSRSCERFGNSSLNCQTRTRISWLCESEEAPPHVKGRLGGVGDATAVVLEGFHLAFHAPTRPPGGRSRRRSRPI